MIRLSRLCMSILLWGLVLGSVTAATAKAPPPSGTLTISTTSSRVRAKTNVVLERRDRRSALGLRGGPQVSINSGLLLKLRFLEGLILTTS